MWICFPAGTTSLIARKEFKPFLMAVLLVVHGNYMTLEGIEGRKQRGRAVALVIMSHRAAAAFFIGRPG